MEDEEDEKEKEERRCLDAHICSLTMFFIFIDCCTIEKKLLNLLNDEKWHKDNICPCREYGDLAMDESTLYSVSCLFIERTNCPTLSSLHLLFPLSLSFFLCSRVVQLERGRGGMQKMKSGGKRKTVGNQE